MPSVCEMFVCECARVCVFPLRHQTSSLYLKVSHQLMKLHLEQISYNQHIFSPNFTYHLALCCIRRNVRGQVVVVVLMRCQVIYL